MTRLLLAAAVVTFAIKGQESMSDPPQPIKVIDTLLADSFLAIQDALTILGRHRPDPVRYKIMVVREEDSTVVLFTDEKGPEGERRDLGARLKADAELDAAEIQKLLAEPDQLDVLDTIQGSSLPAIQTAMGEFQRQNLDPVHYKITVVREGDAIVVMFGNKESRRGDRGGGQRPGFEVEMARSDLSVLRSNLTR